MSEFVSLDDFGSVPSRAEPSTPWYESAADLLAEPHPGPTPFLIEDLIAAGAVAAFVGPEKAWKTWTLLDLLLSVVTGTPALGRFQTPKAGPTLLVIEEAGRQALHRRVDVLARGRALQPESLRDFHFAANLRVRLDDTEWQERLRQAATERPWNLIAFDPFARVKGHVDESVQREVGPVLDFLRELRDLSGAAVLYVHHVPHEGKRQRGSSDLESYWDSRLLLTKDGKRRKLEADHREAEAAGPWELSFGFDTATATVRLTAAATELERRVRAHLDEHPDDLPTKVYEAIGGRKADVLELAKRIREAGSHSPEPPGTTPPGQGSGSGSPAPPFRGAGTTPADLASGAVPTTGNPRALIGDHEYLHPIRAALDAGHVTADELRRAELAHRFVLTVSGPQDEAGLVELTRETF